MVFDMLGGSEFRLRQGFSFGKTLVTAQRRRRPEGRYKLYAGIYTVAMLHVGASCISLAPTFYKSQSALIPLLLLSDRDSLRWIRGRFLTGDETKISGMKPPAKKKCHPFAAVT